MVGRWVLLLILLFGYTLNQWDRFALSYLVSYSAPACTSVCHGMDPGLCSCPGEDPACTACLECRRAQDMGANNLAFDVCLTGVEYGVLTGFGFSLLYSVVGVLSGALADVFGAVQVLVSGVLLWSLASASQALASSFAALLGSRVVLGIGESVGAPASYSLIALAFPAAERGVANGIFAVGVYIGGGLAALTLLVDESIGWRGTVLLTGALGLVVVGALLVSAQFPARHADIIPISSVTTRATTFDHSGAQRPPILATLGDPTPQHDRGDDPSSSPHGDSGDSEPLLMDKATGVPTTRYIAGYSIGSYFARFAEAAFPGRNTELAVASACVIGIVGAISSVGGGALADWIGRRRGLAWKLAIPAVGGVLACGGMALALMAQSFELCMLGLALEYLCAECWFGPVMSVLQALAPAGRSATTISGFVLLTTLAGSTAPAILGAVWDALPTGHEAEIRWTLLGMVVGSYCVSGVLMAVAGWLVSQADAGPRVPGVGRAVAMP